MPSSRVATRSFLALILLATTIGAATASIAARPVAPPVAPVPPTAHVLGAATGEVKTASATTVRWLAGSPGDSQADLRREQLATRTSVPVASTWIDRSSADTPAPSPRTESTAAAPLSGRNKVWIPSLGIRKSVTGFACSSNAYPGNRVYRWGCAGSNNIYLFGHAHSVFKPLHDAYVRGRLSKGMKVHYADANGRVSTYKVAWWKVVRPDKGEFAYAPQSRPSMTLQTCVGAKSQYRLVVRLVKAS
jgi:sortase (surface protein transpeptidase)